MWQQLGLLDFSMYSFFLSCPYVIINKLFYNKFGIIFVKTINYFLFIYNKFLKLFYKPVNFAFFFVIYDGKGLWLL